MEVKSGYKHTEVGTIPEEWNVPHLRLHLLQDSTYGVVKAGTFQRTGIPMLRGGDIKSGAILDDQPLITPEKSKEYSRTILKEQDVVISLVGYPGESAVVPARLAGANISRAVGLLRPAKTLLPEFLTCYLNSPGGRKEFLRPSAGSAQIVVNLRALNQLRLPLPQLEEQRAIAVALSDVDALLGALDLLIAKKRDLKQAAMQQLLTGETRLPGFHGEWETLPARDIGVFTGGSGFALSAQGETDGEYPFFKVSDMNNEGNGTFMTTANHYVSERTRKRLSATAFPAGSIVFAKVGAAIFLERKKILGQASCIDNNMAAFVLDKSRADVGYVHSLLLSKKLGSLVATTALPALNAKQLGEMPLAVPPLSEQIAIATVLSDVDAELSGLEARRDKTRAIKQAMMQELLTGKTRLVPTGGADA